MNKLDQYHYHEITDRAHMLSKSIEAAFEAHPVIKDNPELAKLYTQAWTAMRNLYLRAAVISNEQFPPSKS